MKLCKVTQIGTSPEGNPIYEIGKILKYEGDKEPVVITATVSRKNSMEKVGGWHFALSTSNKLTWADADAINLFAENLTFIWRNVEQEALTALLPHLSEEKIRDLECQTACNSQFTAQRDDLHAHVRVASKSVWASGDVARLTDDARTSSLMAKDIIREYKASTVGVFDVYDMPEQT
jgi:hypothetical protein